MKVAAGEQSEAPSRPTPARSFLQALRGVPTPRPPGGLRCHLAGAAGTAALARSRPGSAEALRAVRGGMHAEARRLGEVRAHGLGQGEQRQEQRALELISRELARPPTRETPGAAALAPQPTSPVPAQQEVRGEGEAQVARKSAAGGAEAPSEPVAPALRAQEAMALIERIELFVRSQRPAMALSVGGALAATVEVERTGPREVALRIQGRRGPPAREDLAQLRAALEARGLQLRSLQAS